MRRVFRCPISAKMFMGAGPAHTYMYSYIASAPSGRARCPAVVAPRLKKRRFAACQLATDSAPTVEATDNKGEGEPFWTGSGWESRRKWPLDE